MPRTPFILSRRGKVGVSSFFDFADSSRTEYGSSTFLACYHPSLMKKRTKRVTPAVLLKHMQDMKIDLHGEMQSMKTDLRSEMQGMKVELLDHMQGMKNDLQTQITALDRKTDRGFEAVRFQFEDVHLHLRALQEDLEETIRVQGKHGKKLARL
jgi:hypothetical protein